MTATAANPTYRAHWGLRETPFRGGLDPRYFYQSPVHEEAVARLHFLVEERQRLGLVIGETGTGKSMLLEVLSRQLRRRGCQVANLSLVGLDLREFLWLIAAELGLNPDARADVFGLWRSVLDRLAENRYQQLETIILLDDCHEANREVLEHLARLTQAERGPNGLLTFVLAFAPGRPNVLPPRLLELAELRIDVERWDEPDTIGYLNWSLSQAGRQTPAFTDEAMIRLHALSEGVPRRVNQLASLALLAGASQQARMIEADIIEAVHHELAVIDAAA